MTVGFVAVVDYGMGNLDSVRRALEVVGARVVVTSDPSDLVDADRIVLPGVGAFGVAMEHLRERCLDEALAVQVAAGAPLLGICLGMQLLATVGTEHGTHKGLGWIDASVDRLVPTDTDRRVPHVGWNSVATTGDHPLLDGIEPGSDFYFVHSYRVVCADETQSLATTPYAGGFTSVVGLGTTVGVQFHPEKSQHVGRRLLRNFLAL